MDDFRGLDRARASLREDFLKTLDAVGADEVSGVTREYIDRLIEQGYDPVTARRKVLGWLRSWQRGERWLPDYGEEY